METASTSFWMRVSSGGLETKYRDIADGNIKLTIRHFTVFLLLETKYRDIADGNSAGLARS